MIQNYIGLKICSESSKLRYELFWCHGFIWCWLVDLAELIDLRDNWTECGCFAWIGNFDWLFIWAGSVTWLGWGINVMILRADEWRDFWHWCGFICLPIGTEVGARTEPVNRYGANWCNRWRLWCWVLQTMKDDNWWGWSFWFRFCIASGKGFGREFRTFSFWQSWRERGCGDFYFW